MPKSSSVSSSSSSSRCWPWCWAYMAPSSPDARSSSSSSGCRCSSWSSPRTSCSSCCSSRSSSSSSSSSPSSSSSSSPRRARSSEGTWLGLTTCRKSGRCGRGTLSAERALSRADAPSMDSRWGGCEFCGEMELMLRRPPWFSIAAAWCPWKSSSSSAPVARYSGRAASCFLGAPWARGGGALGCWPPPPPWECPGPGPWPSCCALSCATFCRQRCSRFTASSSSKCSRSTRSRSTRFSRTISLAARRSSARVVGSLECGPSCELSTPGCSGPQSGTPSIAMPCCTGSSRSAPS
mmetsp:Transcript_57310/g.148913  ORF Transcript_57310/g.148913 Transcript_57310/m.148913 type:complete len:294 (+) Transcript_57310:218-1099(+)